MKSSQPDPGHIMQTATAFWSSKVLLTAVEFDLFSILGDKSMTAKELGDELGLHPRGIYDFFDALVALDFLEREGDGPEGRYKNTGKAFDALPAGGAFIAIENLIDDARRENAFGLLMSLNMLIEFGDAFDYTGADFKEWCSEAGFSQFEIIPLAGPTSAAVAYK